MLHARVFLFFGASLVTGNAWSFTFDDPEWLRAQLEERLAEALGRAVTIGAMTVDVGPTLTVTAEDVVVANPDWATDEHLLQLERAVASVSLGALVEDGRLTVERLALVEPVVALQRESAERATWRFGRGERASQGPGREPQDGAEEASAAEPTLLDGDHAIEELVVEGGRVLIDDDPTNTDVEVVVAAITGSLPRDAQTRLDLEGSIDRTALRASVEAGPLSRSGDPEQPYPITLRTHLGEAFLALDGEIVEPMSLGEAAFAMHVEGPSLNALPQGLGLPLPNTPPYELDGRLVHGERGWAIQDFTGSIGETRATGSLAFLTDAVRPKLSGNVDFGLLRTEDLGGLVGAGPRDPEPPGIFPTVSFEEDRLYSFDADIELSAAEIRAGFPTDSMRTRLVIDSGRAELSELHVEMAGGTLDGEIALNGREAIASADADVTLAGISLKPFFRDTRFVQQMGGTFSGSLHVLGVGRSLDAMAGSARGHGHLAMEDGSMSGLLVELAGLDVIESLAMAVEDARVRVSCARADFEIEEGVALFEQIVVDTPDSVLVGDGAVDLGEETLDLVVEGRAKDFSLIDVAAPVHVRGPITSPGFSIGALQGVPLFEFGDQPPIDCPRLLSGELRLPSPD